MSMFSKVRAPGSAQAGKHWKSHQVTLYSRFSEQEQLGSPGEASRGQNKSPESISRYLDRFAGVQGLPLLVAAQSSWQSQRNPSAQQHLAPSLQRPVGPAALLLIPAALARRSGDWQRLWKSNPGIPTPTDSHLQLQQRCLCRVWVSPGGHASLPGLGRGGEGGVWNGIYATDVHFLLQVAQSRCPRGRMGSALPVLGKGPPGREWGLGPPGLELLPESKAEQQAARPPRVCLLPGQQDWGGTTGLCSDMFFSQ